jgi:putative ABC transport system permease protein
MTKNYFKIAWRNLWLNRKITLINVIGLTIGMVAAVLIMLWVQNELSFDGYNKDANRIYRIKNKLFVSKSEAWIWEASPYILGDFAQKQIPQIENVARIEPQDYTPLTIHYNGELRSEKKWAYVDEQWFNMFQYNFIDGSPGSFQKNPFSLIITASTAKRYFGNREPVGQILKLDTVNYQVQAVVADNPSNSSFQFDILVPLAAKLTDPNQEKQLLEWGNFNDLTFFKVAPKTNLAAATKTLNQIIAKNKKGSKITTSLVALKDVHFENDLQSSSLVHGDHKMVNIFLILSVLILVTACINYVNLTTARASSRSKEVSMRKIVGAGRWHLFGQFISESFLVSFISLVFAILLIQVSMPWFNMFTGKQFAEPLSLGVTWMILSGTLSVCFLMNGIYPAVLLSSFKPLNIFRGKNVLSINDANLRRVLVVLQFSISVVLLIGTIVVYKQLKFMENVDLGYDKSHVFEFQIPWSLTGFDEKKSASYINSFKNELKQQSSISDLSVTNTDKLYDDPSNSSGGFDWEGRAKDFDPGLCVLSVDNNFPKMMQLKLAQGRWFNGEKADTHNVVLNETAVKELHIHQPLLGQVFRFQGDTGVIIGVAKDFHYQNLHKKIGPMLITNHTDWGLCFYVKTRPNNTAVAIQSAQKIWAKFIPSEPFSFVFLDDAYNNLYQTEQQSSMLIAIFAAIAILVSGMGLLGLVTFAAQLRVKEIGIRKVLGASIQSIVRLLSVDFIKMVLIAGVIAFPVAWWAMSKWLQDFAYKIDLSWWIFGLAIIITLIVALITVSIQGIKAALANPVDSLRSE